MIFSPFGLFLGRLARFWVVWLVFGSFISCLGRFNIYKRPSKPYNLLILSYANELSYVVLQDSLQGSKYS